MFDKIAEKRHWSLEYVPDADKAREICERVIEKRTSVLEYILGNYKTQEI